MLESRPAVEPIAPTLDRVIARSLRKSDQAPIAAWPLACGSTVAERTNAIDFVRGVLWVEVPDAGWRTELRRFTTQYLVAINRYVGSSVSQIEFVVKNEGRTQK